MSPRNPILPRDEPLGLPLVRCAHAAHDAPKPTKDAMLFGKAVKVSLALQENVDGPGVGADELADDDFAHGAVCCVRSHGCLWFLFLRSGAFTPGAGLKVSAESCRALR